MKIFGNVLTDSLKAFSSKANRGNNSSNLNPKVVTVSRIIITALLLFYAFGLVGKASVDVQELIIGSVIGFWLS